VSTDKILQLLEGVHAYDGYWQAQCPAHDDQDPSLSIRVGDDGRTLLHCHVGCPTEEVVAAIGLSMADLFPKRSPTARAGGPRSARGRTVRPSSAKTAAKRPGGLKLAEYAAAKGLPEDFLRYLGLSDVSYQGAPAVRIPYHGPDGEEIAIRFRIGLSGDRFRWERNTKPDLYLLNHLDPLSPSVTVVEGESNAQTLLFAGFPVLGLPGANGWREDRDAARLAEIARIVVVVDPDRGGEAVLEWVARSSIRDRVHLIRLDPYKDVSKLYLDDPGRFIERFQLALDAATPWKEPEAVAPAAELLDGLVAFVRRFVVLSLAQARVVAFWILHTHSIEAADATPYLSITSPEKRSGKTRLLEVLELLVARAWLTGRVTAAVLFRKIDAEHPTLLLDESDAAFKGEKEYAEALRGILNTGHRRSGRASLCVGQGANISYRDFSTFCAKAISGIGKLPDTVADRSIPIRLKRRARNEEVQRFRRREAETEATALRHQIEVWAVANIQQLKDARPAVLQELSDRAADCAEPLLAIADLAGDDWPARAREALITLFEAERSEDSVGVQLLGDVRRIFEDCRTDRLKTTDLLHALRGIDESPWAEFNKGKSLTAHGLARLLNSFGIESRTIRVENVTPKGYLRGMFEDAWERYLPKPSEPGSLLPEGSENATTPQTNDDGRADPLAEAPQTVLVAGLGVEKGKADAGCGGVAEKTPSEGGTSTDGGEDDGPNGVCDPDDRWDDMDSEDVDFPPIPTATRLSATDSAKMKKFKEILKRLGREQEEREKAKELASRRARKPDKRPGK